MKCKCCDNKIWIEEINSDTVEIFTRKGDTYTGVVLTREDAIELATDILKKMMTIDELYQLIADREKENRV